MNEFEIPIVNFLAAAGAEVGAAAAVVGAAGAVVGAAGAAVGAAGADVGAAGAAVGAGAGAGAHATIAASRAMSDRASKSFVLCLYILLLLLRRVSICFFASVEHTNVVASPPLSDHETSTFRQAELVIAIGKDGRITDINF
jgi:hypothetical protein